MAVTLGPKLGLLINANEGDVYVDQFRPLLRFIDSMLLGNVINSTATVPPGAPGNGDAYLLLGTPTGAWAGHANAIAVWSTEITTAGTDTKVPGWAFWAPHQGWIIWDIAASCFRVYTASGWQAMQIAPPLATTSTPGLVKPDGTTIAISGGVISAAAPALATLSTPGSVKPDGTTITISGGVISATAASGLTYTQVAVTSPAPGNFSLAHGVGVVPKFVLLNVTSAGAIWWQSTMWDATNIYLEASEAGLTAVAIVAH